jgi:hypothetical protein
MPWSSTTRSIAAGRAERVVLGFEVLVAGGDPGSAGPGRADEQRLPGRELVLHRPQPGQRGQRVRRADTGRVWRRGVVSLATELPHGFLHRGNRGRRRRLRIFWRVGGCHVSPPPVSSMSAIGRHFGLVVVLLTCYKGSAC